MTTYKYPRIFLIVTDSVGIGGDVRAHEFNNENANTLASALATNLVNMPNWTKLGILALANPNQSVATPSHAAYMMRLSEKSNVVDSIAGHWEMMGVVTEKAMPNYSKNGFPADLIAALEKAIGRQIVGNRNDPGTTIINDFAEVERTQNKLLVYTSGDSTMQICGHETHMGLNELYKICQIAREVCNSKPEWKMGRIIARPYVGENGVYTRTPNRRDFTVTPPQPTILEALQAQEVKTIAIGKTIDMFAGRGFDEVQRGTSDEANMDLAIAQAKTVSGPVLVFTNLTDFDSKFGHPRNAKGYAENLNRFDAKLGALIALMREDDLLLISSDHGNDPTYRGTDHTREEVPLTIYAKNFRKAPSILPKASGLGTVGNIIARNFNVAITNAGGDIFGRIE